MYEAIGAAAPAEPAPATVDRTGMPSCYSQQLHECLDHGEGGDHSVRKTVPACQPFLPWALLPKEITGPDLDRMPYCPEPAAEKVPWLGYGIVAGIGVVVGVIAAKL